MIPSFLITLREIIEASLIVATILGILTKLGAQRNIKTVWFATACAFGLSIILLLLSTAIGINLQRLYNEHEAYIEGTLMIVSATFVTWAVFFLHKHFSRKKVHLLQKVKTNIEQNELNGLFILVFTAVFREGLEIVLFLSTIYLTNKPNEIFQGTLAGLVGGLLLSFALFKATIRIPIYSAFRITSFLLILFAAGLLVRGLHEFIELGFIPKVGNISFNFLPRSNSFIGGLIQSVFGLSKEMNVMQLSFYCAYTITMSLWVIKRKS